MFAVDWQNIKEEDLKEADFLEKAFRKFLRNECNYTTEEAKFAADIIREPFRRNFNHTEKTYVQTIEICKTIYEIYFCTDKDSSEVLFEYYTLVDIATKGEAHFGDQLLSYISARKRFVLPNKYTPKRS